MIVKAYEAVGDDGFARYGGDVVYVEDAEHGVADDAWDDGAWDDDAWDDDADGRSMVMMWVVGNMVMHGMVSKMMHGMIGMMVLWVMGRIDDADGKQGEAVYNEHVGDVDALDNALPVLLKAADR